MTDGLEELNQRRAAGTQRRVPPPKHAPTAPGPPAPVDAAEGESSRAKPAAQAAPVKSHRPAPAKATTAAELLRQTIFLDDQSDALLEDVRRASRSRRVDANRSAVVRLALRRLADELTPTRSSRRSRRPGARPVNAGQGGSSFN